jgi:hypothetical protein
MVSNYLTLAELHTPVGTFVQKTAHFPSAVSPEDEFLSHPDHTHWFVSNLGGIHNYIPLLRNHIAPRGLEQNLISIQCHCLCIDTLSRSSKAFQLTNKSLQGHIMY